MDTLSNMGWLACLLGLSAMWFITGWQWCESRHKTRGIEIDRTVPDIVPPAWTGGGGYPGSEIKDDKAPAGGTGVVYSAPARGWMSSSDETFYVGPR